MPADAALCARDTDLPGLGAVLNASSVSRTIDLGNFRHSYLNYKPRTNCVAGLVPVDGSLGAWVAMTYPRSRWPEIRNRPKWNNGPQKAVYLDDACTVFVPLALERRLRKARQLSDDTSRTALLSRLGLANHPLRILRYKPGRRIVLRADGPHGPIAVIKMHADRATYDRAFAGAVYANAMGGPAVIGTAPDDLAIATAWTPGHALSPQSAPRDFNLAGAMLAQHHVMGPKDKLSDWKPPALHQTVQTVSTLMPELETQAQRLASQLPELDASELVALHGDFSADQVIRDGHVTVILDWDRAARGPAARDLGSALARLDLDEIEGFETGEARTALLEGYGAVRTLPPGKVIAAHRAHALFALAVEAFRARSADWDQQMRSVLGRVEEICQNPPIPATKGTIPGLAKALEPEHMRTGFGKKPKAITLTRLKPGRRAMVQYVLPDGQVLLGKLRAKGADRNAPHFQSKLRAAGLDGCDGVGVAAVTGTVDDPAIWLQEQVPGHALIDVQDGSAPAKRDAMRRTGRALAKLHGTPVQTTRQWTHADEWAVLEKALSGGPHDDLLSLAKARLDGLPRAPHVGLHRDFYFDQVLVTPDTIWLVDLDLYAVGDAAIDLGNFLAHLDELALRHGEDPSHFAALQDAFLQGYSDLASLPDMQRVNSFRWISLARHIAIAARFPDRRHAIPAVEALCRSELSKVQ
ncbi:hypothetical protein RA29_18460 [Tateyamaria sp. ANG-S1]|nr:hypothetical protein RA29_18460 [Tateyamaria sp. ANG-S1]